MIRASKNSARKSSREPTGFRSTVDANVRTIWIADAHRGDGKRFVARADEKLTALILPFAFLGALPWLLSALALGGETSWDRQSYGTVLISAV
jgi:hypothetical protein